MLSNTRFRSHVDLKDGGSVTLGFADATITLGTAQLELLGVTVRLTADGKPALTIPRRPWTGRDEIVRYAHVVRFDEPTYRSLVVEVFALPAVSAAVHEALALRAAAQVAV